MIAEEAVAAKDRQLVQAQQRVSSIENILSLARAENTRLSTASETQIAAEAKRADDAAAQVVALQRDLADARHRISVLQADAVDLAECRRALTVAYAFNAQLLKGRRRFSFMRQIFQPLRLTGVFTSLSSRHGRATAAPRRHSIPVCHPRTPWRFHVMPLSV